MSMNDNISDMLTRMRNAQLRGYVNLAVPFSRLKDSILSVLADSGYIDYKRSGHELIISLRYTKFGKPLISQLTRVSKFGKRVYCSARELRTRKDDMGLLVLSTSSGIFSDRVARERNVGGEVLIKVF